MRMLLAIDLLSLPSHLNRRWAPLYKSLISIALDQRGPRPTKAERLKLCLVGAYVLRDERRQRRLRSLG